MGKFGEIIEPLATIASLSRTLAKQGALHVCKESGFQGNNGYLPMWSPGFAKVLSLSVPSTLVEIAKDYDAWVDNDEWGKVFV